MLDTLIKFLVDLFRDEEKKAAFDENPQGELSKNGLQDVSAQDVRDARLIMADQGGMRAREGSQRSSSDDDDPVREIQHTRQNFEVDQDFQRVEQTFNIDDRDITIIDDSFNSDDDTDVKSVAIQDNDSETNVVQVKDSFNDKETEPEPKTEPVASEEPEEQEPEPEVVIDDPVEVPAAEEPVAVVEDPVEPEPAETFVG